MLLPLLLAVAALQGRDTVLIRSTEPAAWASALPLKPAFRIGTVDGPAEIAFGSIEQLAATEAGSFVTYDGSDTQLRRYDATGKFLGLIGRSGGGPGEYRTVDAMVFLGDSLLAVWDPRNQRVSIFSADGVYRRAILVPGAIFGGDRPLLAAPNGHFLIRVPRSAARLDQGLQAEYLEYDASGQVRNTFPDLRAAQGDSDFVVYSPDGPRWNFPVESLYARSPAGELIRGHSADLGFWFKGATGPARHVTRAARPLPLTGAERKQWEDWRALFAERISSAPRPVPAHKPLVRALNADPAGRIWLEVYAEATMREPKPRPPGDKRPQFTLRDPSTYEVFTSAGRYLGRIALAPDAALMTITSRMLYVLDHGSKGEEQIVGYPLPPIPR